MQSEARIYSNAELPTENVTALAKYLLLGEDADEIGIAHPAAKAGEMHIVTHTSRHDYMRLYKEKTNGRDLITSLLDALALGDPSRLEGIADEIYPLPKRLDRWKALWSYPKNRPYFELSMGIRALAKPETIVFTGTEIHG